MSRDESNRPEPTATQAAAESIEEVLTPCLVAAPLGGTLELGRDGQFRYDPRRNYLSAADIFEFVAAE